MPGFLDKYKTDETAETEGKWMDLGDGVQVKVVRLNHPAARKLRATLDRPYRNRETPPEKQEEFLSVVMARAVVKDWKGVTDEHGNEIAFSPDEALRLFKKYPDFRDDVGVMAADRDQFKADDIEEDVGNS